MFLRSFFKIFGEGLLFGSTIIFVPPVVDVCRSENGCHLNSTGLYKHVVANYCDLGSSDKHQGEFEAFCNTTLLAPRDATEEDNISELNYLIVLPDSVLRGAFADDSIPISTLAALQPQTLGRVFIMPPSTMISMLNFIWNVILPTMSAYSTLMYCFRGPIRNLLERNREELGAIVLQQRNQLEPQGLEVTMIFRKMLLLLERLGGDEVVLDKGFWVLSHFVAVIILATMKPNPGKASAFVKFVAATLGDAVETIVEAVFGAQAVAILEAAGNATIPASIGSYIVSTIEIVIATTIGIIIPIAILLLLGERLIVFKQPSVPQPSPPQPYSQQSSLPKPALPQPSNDDFIQQMLADPKPVDQDKLRKMFLSSVVPYLNKFNEREAAIERGESVVSEKEFRETWHFIKL